LRRRREDTLLKIWGREDSLSVQKVMWCIRELDIPYEQINLGKGYDSPNQPWYLKMNPTGTIPTIDDDGFILWESNAIVKYLCAKHSPGNLSPTDPHEYADADRWISWQGTTLWPPMREVLLKLVRMPEDKRDPNRIAELVATVTEHWEVLNGRLDGRKYIMGERFTMADIVFGPHIYRWFTYPIPRPNLPHLRAWYERFLTHKYYKPRFTAGDVVTAAKE
jgi:glutathione S-transferase